MRFIALLLMALGLAASPASAREVYTQTIVIEEWVDENGKVVRTETRTLDESSAGDDFATPRLDYAVADRAITSRAARTPTAMAAFGPFRVVDPTRAVLVGATGEGTPAQFAALLRAYPQLKTLDLLEAPGTENDKANLEVGRMIRAAGLTTRVPEEGSVRSGAVELFLAGVRREIAPGAQFAVHSWRDNRGMEARDYPEGAPEHVTYLDYYREMGMSEDGAAAFYRMTNSVPHASARWLNAVEMQSWLSRAIAPARPQLAAPSEDGQPRIAYLDLASASP